MSKDLRYDNTKRYGRYLSVEQFKSEFTGVWSPSDNLWTALDFTYGEKGYRLDTGWMYGSEPKKTRDGKDAVFYVYDKTEKYGWCDDDPDKPLFVFHDCYATIDDVLEKFTIDGKKFKDIILEDDFGIMEKN